MIHTIEWTDAGVVMLDQLLLPGQEIYHTYSDYRDVAEAIRSMVIRGAPAIGIAAAMGIALGVKNLPARSQEELDTAFESICSEISSTRPTAVNLFWAVDRMKSVYRHARSQSLDTLSDILIQEALKMHREDIGSNKEMGRLGQELIPNKARILTHCNAGALATAGYGTALGVILQGARLTAWELQKDNIPVTVITDSMAGYFMHKGNIDCVIVGADRIAANGDVANKIGTYSVAVLAKENQIPFMVAAPISTIDLNIPDGSHIRIEERDPNEVRKIQGISITPENTSVKNPSFDVTPARYVSAILTDRGIARSPYSESLPALFRKSSG
jgi:methylthioribose-1-phosphate isomerase